MQVKRGVLPSPVVAPTGAAPSPPFSICCVQSPSLPSVNTQVCPSFVHTFTGSLGVPSGPELDGEDELEVQLATSAQAVNIEERRSVRSAVTPPR
jgi:hypothetical protein